MVWLAPIVAALVFVFGIIYQLYINKQRKREQFKDDLNSFTKRVNELVHDKTTSYKDALIKVEMIWNSIMAISPIVKAIDKEGNYYINYFWIMIRGKNGGMNRLFSCYISTLKSVISMQRTENIKVFESVNVCFTECLMLVLKTKMNIDEIGDIILRFKNLAKSRTELK